MTTERGQDFLAKGLGDYASTPAEYLLPMECQSGQDIVCLVREVLKREGIQYSNERFRLVKFDSTAHCYRFVINLDPGYVPPERGRI